MPKFFVFSDVHGFYDEFIKTLNEAGYDKIYLHTHKNLDGALEFWTKMGFVVALDSNDELETVHMDKKIQKLDISHLSNDYSYAIYL